MRGLPGSGKSYWIEQYLKSQGLDVAIRAQQYGYFSTDRFFYQDGEYQFNAAKLSEYHQRNLTQYIQALASQEPIVICDNTNMCHWEYSAYKAAAQALGYKVNVILVGEPKSIKHQQQCAKRNQHGVSLEHIKRMAKVFED